MRGKAAPTTGRERGATRWRIGLIVSLFLLSHFSPPTPLLLAQVPADLLTERQGFAEWLKSAPNSPLAAIARSPIGAGLTLGPDTSDVPLPGLGLTRLIEEGAGLILTTGEGRRPVPRYRVFSVGPYRFNAGGDPGRTVLTVFRPHGADHAPGYFPYNASAVVAVALAPTAQPRARRVLSLDGDEVEATDAGSVSVALGGTTSRLEVYRIPDPPSEELELVIYFQDATSGHGSYPAGRFVTLTPAGRGAYRIDFNRARNPFCAYSSLYPCPVPWAGNVIPTAVRAGETYGLPVETDAR